MSFTLALPKGRLGEEAELLLLKCGIMETPIPKESRKLIFPVGREIKILLLRAWDVPTYIEAGTADIGICGKDDLMEHDADLIELLDLGFGLCKMAVAAEKNKTREDIFSRPYLKVATKYPGIAKKYFSSLSVQAEIIKLYGSVELAAVTNMSDCIVDIVSTGSTLRENGLSIIETLFTSTARIVVNRAAYYRNLEFINGFIKKIRTVL